MADTMSDQWQRRPSAGTAGDSMTTSRPRPSEPPGRTVHGTPRVDRLLVLHEGKSVPSVASDVDLTELNLRTWVERARRPHAGPHWPHRRRARGAGAAAHRSPRAPDL